MFRGPTLYFKGAQAAVVGNATDVAAGKLLLNIYKGGRILNSRGGSLYVLQISFHGTDFTYLVPAAMTEADLFTPLTESPRTGHDGMGSPSGTKAIIDIDSVLIRLKECSHTPPLVCIRKLRGTKQCENRPQTWSPLALKIRDSLQGSHEITLWEPHVKQIMQFLHCENHWKHSQHREAVKNIWEGLAPSFKDEFISTTMAFIEWFCIPYGEGYIATSGHDTTYLSLPGLDEPPEILQANRNAGVIAEQSDRPSQYNFPSQDLHRILPAHDYPSDDDREFVSQSPTPERSPRRPERVPLMASLSSETSRIDSSAYTSFDNSGRRSVAIAVPNARSAEELPHNQHTPTEVDGRIERVMTQSVTMNNEDTLYGDVYILKHRTITNDPCTRYLKIGYSVITDRRKREVSCQNLRTVFAQRIAHARRVETLAHRELSNFKRDYSCCKKHHSPSGKKEWYDVDEEVAIQVVQRWLNFMKQEPYGANGELKSFWKSRLSCRTRADDKKERFDDHHTRHKRWNTFVSPTWADWMHYHICSYWRALRRRWPWIWKYRWRIVSISLALWLSWTISSPYHLIGYLLLFWCLLELVWEGALGAPVQTRVRKN